MHSHWHTLIHMYDLLKRNGASVTGCCWTGQLPWVQMIMTLSDHLFVAWSTWTPIHYAVSLQLHFWMIHTLLSNYSLLLNDCRGNGKWIKWKTQKCDFCSSGSSHKKRDTLCKTAFCTLIVVNYMGRENCYVCDEKIFLQNFLLHLRLQTFRSLDKTFNINTVSVHLQIPASAPTLQRKLENRNCAHTHT